MADPNDDEWLYGANDEADASEVHEEKMSEVEEEVISAKNGNIEMSFDEHNFEVKYYVSFNNSKTYQF